MHERRRRSVSRRRSGEAVLRSRSSHRPPRAAPRARTAAPRWEKRRTQSRMIWRSASTKSSRAPTKRPDAYPTQGGIAAGGATHDIGSHRSAQRSIPNARARTVRVPTSPRLDESVGRRPETECRPNYRIPRQAPPAPRAAATFSTRTRRTSNSIGVPDAPRTFGLALFSATSAEAAGTAHRRQRDRLPA
jgi:hypothetical protein